MLCNLAGGGNARVMETGATMRNLALASVSFVLLGGCAGLPSKPAFNRDSVLPAMTPIAAPAGSPAASTEGPPTTCATDPPASKADRNKCIYDLMTQIDNAYGLYEIKVNNRVSQTNAALAIAQSAFSISGTASTGTSAKVLNSLGTFTGDVKTTISDELLYKTAIQIVISTMQADRAKLAAQITLKMQQELADYPLNQAKNDLLAYYYAGTVTHALSDANNDAGTAAQTCKSAATAVKTAVTLPNNAQVAAAQGAAAGATATTTDQCNQISQALTYKADTSTTATDLLTLLAPNGVYNKDAAAALTDCIKTTAPPSGTSLANYTTPAGEYKLGSIIANPAVDPKYKAQLLTCAKAGVAKAQATAAVPAPPPAQPPARQPSAPKKKG